MYKYEFGFIGTGNMGSALAAALNASNEGVFPVALSNRTVSKAEKLAEKLNINANKEFVVTTNGDIARNAHYILLGVKPQMYPELLSEIALVLSERHESHILVTMAAGIKMAALPEGKIIRIMPNTPLAINEGVILAAKNDFVTDEEFGKFVEAFSPAGAIHEMPENLIDAGSVVSGCGPAYAYMFIEAMAEAGAKLGLPKDLAILLAKETVRGAASLSEQSDESLESLRISVCSPGGSTIEGVKSLDSSDFNGIISKALEAAFNRTKELGGEK